MPSSLKRKNIADSDRVPCKKLKRRISSSSYASVRAWLLRNYEIVAGSFTLCDHLLSHAMEEQENIAVEKELTMVSLMKAVRDVFGPSRRVSEKGKEKRRAVEGIKRRHNEHILTEKADVDQEWDKLSHNISHVAHEVGSWTVVFNKEFSLSCIKADDVRFNNQRVIMEIIFSKDVEHGQIHTSITYRHLPLRLEEAKVLEKQLNDLEAIERARCLMTFLGNTSVCMGTQCADRELELHNISLERVVVSDPKQGILEERVFSSECKILTNSGGKCCSRCSGVKFALRKKMARQQRATGPHPYCNHRYLSREQILGKLKAEKKNCLSQQRQRAKIAAEMLEMEELDHLDLQKMMTKVEKDGIPEDMAIFWEEQQKILRTPRNRYRWHPKIIKLCVELYSKNPHVLDPLRKIIYLPSNRTIRHYKNKVEQKPGWNSAMLKWCLKEATEKNLKGQDFWGGFVLDEMKIQEDMEMVSRDGKHRLVGFVDLGKIHDDMDTLAGKSDEPKLASHVLQFIFLGDSGFRFPLAQFPSGGCTASDLFFIYWEGVRKMQETGFTVYYCILDGAEVNRQFIKLHFKDEEDAVSSKFVAHNLYTGDPMVFLMDPKHNFKKLRNNILNSGTGTNSTRYLTVGGKHILWEHFVNAFHYDQGEFSLSLHKRLTAGHFELDPASKMRNHLAEDVLDKKMLSLMKAYKEHLRSKPGQDHNCVDATIQLLSHSAKAIQLFHDKQGITSTTDHRLGDLRRFLVFLQNWKAETEKDAKKFISEKLWFDMQSMVLGFEAIVSVKLHVYPQSMLKPAIINQDVVENHFCQVRACNGQNNHPTWRLQETAQNSIRFGQTTISRKSNAGASGQKRHAN